MTPSPEAPMEPLLNHLALPASPPRTTPLGSTKTGTSSTPGREIGQCQKHKVNFSEADYMGRFCPECQREVAEERKREALQRQAAERDARRTSAGIPPRFRNAALDGVPAELARFADDPASMPAGFILLGPPGTGKTYAACAVAIALADARKWAAYMTAKHAVRRVKA